MCDGRQYSAWGGPVHKSTWYISESCLRQWILKRIRGASCGDVDYSYDNLYMVYIVNHYVEYLKLISHMLIASLFFPFVLGFGTMPSDVQGLFLTLKTTATVKQAHCNDYF